SHETTKRSLLNSAPVMTLNDASLVSQIVSSIVVVLTFIGLIISIRQNTRAQLTLSVESLTRAIAAINVPGITAELGEAIAAVLRDWWGSSRQQRTTALLFQAPGAGLVPASLRCVGGVAMAGLGGPAHPLLSQPWHPNRLVARAAVRVFPRVRDYLA